MINPVNRMKRSPLFSRKSIHKLRKASFGRSRDRHSDSSSCSMVTAATEATSKRGVSFSSDDAPVTEVRFIPPISEMSEQEINDTWYTDREYKLLKVFTIRVLRKMITGTLTQEDVDALEYEPRGLESRTPMGRKAQRGNIKSGVTTVVREQHRQLMEHGRMVDPEGIAQKYQLTSAHAVMEAIRIAQDDARIAAAEFLATAQDQQPQQQHHPQQILPRATMGMACVA